MSFKQRREFLFLYSVKDANPNGDPLNMNHPRYDEETEQVLVSDVRIKRTVRDQWLREGEFVFIDGEAKTAPTRIKELQEVFGVSTGKEICSRCIDTRLFGVTYPTEKESFSWTGPVQFKWGRSLHRVKPELVQGTAAFARTEESEQRTFRNEYIVPFALIGVYGIANQYAAIKTGATDDDLEKLKKALWQGTTNLITRSKIGHIPQLLLEIVYQPDFQGAIGSLDDKVSIKKAVYGSAFTKDEEFAIRGLTDVLVDIMPLVQAVKLYKDNIAKINIKLSDSINLIGIAELKSELGDKVAEV